MNTENINNNVEAAQNVNATDTTETTKVSLSGKIWNGTKKAAKVAGYTALTVGYVAVNAAVVILPLAACIKYLRED